MKQTALPPVFGIPRHLASIATIGIEAQPAAVKFFAQALSSFLAIRAASDGSAARC